MLVLCTSHASYTRQRLVNSIVGTILAGLAAPATAGTERATSVSSHSQPQTVMITSRRADGALSTCQWPRAAENRQAVLVQGLDLCCH